MPTPPLTIYDFDQVNAIFGTVLLDGFAEGTAISIERTEDTFTMKTGCDGLTSRSKTLNRTAKVTFTLMQTSAANLKLSLIHALDRDTPNGAGVLPLLVRDNGGSSIHTATQAWISKAPDVKYEREASERTWEISVARLEGVEGGN